MAFEIWYGYSTWYSHSIELHETGYGGHHWAWHSIAAVFVGVR